MTKLPEDIQNFIFYDYIKPDMIMLELEQILRSDESKKLNQQTLYYYLTYVVLKNDIVIENLLRNDKIFKIIYNEHIIKKEKAFVNFQDPINSMALSWLMYLYH